MSGTTYKKFDRNRFRKIYRYLRKKPYNNYMFDKPTLIESSYVDFDGTSSSVVHSLSQTFPALPHVTATAVDYYGNSQADVNVFISKVEINQYQKTQITFEISQLAKCRVHFHAIYIECP